jgi:uncharacterized BrkB/YihY/UPF0761 family membrane protein
MSELQQKTSSRLWPRHLAERKWYGWVIAVVWFLIFLMGVLGVFLPDSEAASGEPLSTSWKLITSIIMAIAFYAIYWFFMMITYYVPEESKKTYKFFFDMLGL